MTPRLLYVASRWPYPVASGRARMIAQTLSMASRSFEVHLAAFAADAADGGAPAHVASATRLPRPGPAGILADLARAPAAPLQSHLFASGAAAARLRELSAELRPQVVVFDMLRLAPYARHVRAGAPGARTVLEMDDLLSRRYAQMDGSADILGAFSRGMPAPVRALAGLLPRAALGLEGRLMRRAEAAAPRAFDAVTLVSGREAAALATRSALPGRISAVPPAVDPAVARPRDFSRGLRVVFLGDERYAPNAEALRALDALASACRGLRGGGVAFEAAGRPDPRVVTPHVRRLGFVDDLDAFLGPDAVMVAPILTGTGIKTKLLDAMVRGVPVVTTPVGAEGLDLVAGRDLVVADPDRLPGTLLDLLGGGGEARLGEMGLSAATRVAADHHPDRVYAALTAALEGAGAPTARPAATPATGTEAVAAAILSAMGPGDAGTGRAA